MGKGVVRKYGRIIGKTGGGRNREGMCGLFGGETRGDAGFGAYPCRRKDGGCYL